MSSVDEGADPGSGGVGATTGELWVRLHRGGAVALVVLVAAQAVIAGQHLFGSWGIDVHAMLGNAAFAVTVAMTAIAFLQLDKRALRVVGVVVVVVLSAQIGLGYSARESDSAAALHIPLGVAVFGVVVYQLLIAWPRLLARERPPPTGAGP